MDTITDTVNMEEILISINKQHLGQAQGTLFTTLEVIKLIGIDGCSQSAESMLNDNADTSGIDLTPLQKIYFSNLQSKKTKGNNSIKSTVPIKDMKDGYKKSTSTSPSKQQYVS